MLKTNTPLLTLAFIMICILGMSPAVHAEGLTKAERIAIYKDYMDAEGYRSRIDQDGDLEFKLDGFTYFIIVQEDDPEYFRIALPNIWPIESEQERLEVFAAANKATADTKVCKVFAMEDNVWISVELFVPDQDAAKAVFRRSLSTIKTAMDEFVSLMKKETPPASWPFSKSNN